MSEVCDLRKRGSFSSFSSTTACSLSYLSLVFLSLLMELPLKMRVYIYYLFYNSRLQCLRSLVSLRISYYFLASAHFIFYSSVISYLFDGLLSKLFDNSSMLASIISSFSLWIVSNSKSTYIYLLFWAKITTTQTIVNVLVLLSAKLADLKVFRPFSYKVSSFRPTSS